MERSMISEKTVGPALSFQKGLRDGLPICLGYLSVSFAYGMMAAEGGLPVWAAVLISMTNLTSSGQVAGTALIFSGSSLLEIGITTFVINIRYMLMSLSLSQKNVSSPDAAAGDFPKADSESPRSLVFILCSVCRAVSHDFSGNFQFHFFPALCFDWAGGGIVPFLSRQGIAYGCAFCSSSGVFG